MNQNTLYSRILEALEESETETSTWDPEIRELLTGDLVVTVTKLLMEDEFDEELEDEEDELVDG